MNEAYEYLMQIRAAESAILRLEIKTRELKSCLLPGAIRYDTDKVMTSPEDKLSKIMAEVDALEREIETRKLEKARLIQEITDMLDLLEDEREKTVLTEFFIGRESMNRVARILNYSARRTYYFRKQGLIHLEEILKSRRKLQK